MKRYYSSNSRYTSKLNSARLFFQRSDAVQINSSVIGRGLLEWFFCHEDNTFCSTQVYRSTLLQEWREKAVQVRHEIASKEDQGLPNTYRPMRQLADAFSEFHILSFHLHELRSLMVELSYQASSCSKDILENLLAELRCRFFSLCGQIDFLVASPLFRAISRSEEQSFSLHETNTCCPLSPFPGSYYQHWQAAFLQLAWTLPLLRMHTHLSDLHRLTKSAFPWYMWNDELERREKGLCKVLTGLEERVPFPHCLLPASTAIWNSVAVYELPQWQTWRHWVRHQLGHLELGGFFLRDKEIERLSNEIEIQEIRKEGLFPRGSSLRQESLKMKKLQLLLSKMTIFDDP